MAISLYGLQSEKRDRMDWILLRLLWLLEQLWCWKRFLQFHVTLRLPCLGLVPGHIRHTHRHRLHPLLELLRDYVRIDHNHHHPRYPGTHVSRYQVPRYLLLSNLFRPRYRRATKKSTVLDHWGKKVHFLVNLFGQWILNMSKSTSCDQVLLKLCSSPAHRGWMFFLILVQSRLRSCKKNCTFSTCNQGLRICAQVPTLALLKFYSRFWKALLKLLSSSFTHVEFRALYSSSTKVLLRALKSCTQVLKSPKKVVFKFY